MELTLKVVDVAGEVRARATGTDEAYLVYRDSYNEGDQVVVEASAPGYLVLALDDAMTPAIVYMKGQSYALGVPFGSKRVPYSPRAFDGKIHRLCVRKARLDEIGARRNLAFNPWDDHANASIFPHARANVETRGKRSLLHGTPSTAKRRTTIMASGPTRVGGSIAIPMRR